MKLIPTFDEKNQNNFNSLSLLLIRLTFGLTMILGHGVKKIDKLFSGGEIKFMNFMGLGEEVSLVLVVFAEFLCAVFLMLGLFTRAVAFPLLFTMLIAIFIVHFNDAFNKLELPIMYAVVYLTLMFTGGGKYSLDYMIWKKS